MATEPDKINTGVLGTIVVVGAFAMLGISLAVTALVRAELDETEARLGQDFNRPVRELTTGQLGELTAPPAYVDEPKGIVSIPIERAMELVVRDLKRNPYAATPGAQTARQEEPSTDDNLNGDGAQQAGEGETEAAPEASTPEGNTQPEEKPADRKSLPPKGEPQKKPTQQTGTKAPPASSEPAPPPSVPAPDHEAPSAPDHEAPARQPTGGTSPGEAAPQEESGKRTPAPKAKPGDSAPAPTSGEPEP